MTVYVTNMTAYREQRHALRDGLAAANGRALSGDGARAGRRPRRRTRLRRNRGDRGAAVINPTTFLYEHDAATSVATITLNRPDRLNALTFEVYDELRDTFRDLSDERGRARRHHHRHRHGVLLRRRRAATSSARCSRASMHGLLEFTRMTCDLILRDPAVPPPGRSPR